MRIAIIGSASFDTDAVDTFLFALAEKYPGATLVVGDGRGAERYVRDQAEPQGFVIETPPLHDEWYGAAALDCQVFDCLMGADAIVIVGALTGSRPKAAADWWKRCRSHEEIPTPLHKIAAKAKAVSEPKRRAKKKQEQLAA